MARLTVALLFGGRSSEHTISCATAGGVLSAIDRSKYDVLPIGITRDGRFTLQPDDASRFLLNPAAMPVVEDNGTRVHFPESAASREFTVTDAAGATRSLGDVDVVFPILHGPFGEDGTVQGLLELLARILSLAPPLADALARRADLLDPLIDASAFDLPGSAADFAAFMRTETERYARVIRAAGIRID